MYISGNQYNYENRIHQLIENTGDFHTYCIEGSGYLNNINSVHLNKWNRELRHVYFEMTKIWFYSPTLVVTVPNYFLLQNGGHLNLIGGGSLTLV